MEAFTNQATSGQAIAMIIYFVAMIIIGIYGYTRTSDLDDFMVGGRQLNPMVAALSAGASDMSGWLLMGLPGALYLTGLVEGWIAVGLTVGAWINWKITAPRLRSYSEIAGNSITVPSFMGARVKDPTKLIRIVAGLIILIFFTFYVSSGIVSGGTFFESTFGMDYHVGMTLVAGIVILYTLVGGFLAVSYTDVVQGLMMLVALIVVPAVALGKAGGMGEVVATLNSEDDSLFAVFGPHGLTLAGAVSIISALAWGLGYFGQPHIIVRFMALKAPKQARAARRIGIGWMALSVIGAGLTALVGRALSIKGYIPDLTHSDNNAHETVFLVLGQKLFPSFLAGFMLAAILAAIMSTVSSQLIVSSSAVVEDVYKGLSSRELVGNQGITMGRLSVLAISVIAAILAWFRTDSILGLVSFAWAGFGAAFGPVVILSLYWRRLTWQGALAGMVVGAVTVGVWGNLPDNVPLLFQVYEILPGFLFNLLAAWAVSAATYKPNPQIDAEFDEAVRLAR
ncbi:sodium/proline symporter PutP [Nanchangia anserum]|uniref:Sodium/proline symporter n=1 Tax=Nanchangia anserum TaxID=2692125 RepID=A0A8I0GGN4_9ACTO|nr:sodium/proline symporter PutP [Nanchangia anserum]MBD3689674.1 sodium/proline symporter PutP [Nanchangia anserum]QOX81851.1 sodium/proline symporter PutP [Nanchangia anserum]